MELNIPFAETGNREDFPINATSDQSLSLEKGYPIPYQLKPEEGGKFILRPQFNQAMYLVSKEVVDWRIQAFPNWSAELSAGLKYNKNSIVKYTDSNVYISKIDNNTSLPTSSDWINFNNLIPTNTTPTITGTATFNGTTQTIDLTGVGNITLAIGDVIQVTGTTNNNKLFTVESIPSANQIIVNYEHRGTSTPIPKGRLINETATATITLYNRAKNAPSGQGQYWCVPASGRAKDVDYPNNTNREIKVSISYTYSSGASATILVDGFPTTLSGGVGAMNIGEISVGTGAICKFTSASALQANGWVEKR